MERLALKIIDLSDLGFGKVISSISKEEIDLIILPRWYSSESFKLILQDFTYSHQGPLKDFLRSPKDFSSCIVEEIWKKFCTGTYWFYGSVILKLESHKALSEEDSLQFLAIIITLCNPQSQPVVLYQVEKLV